MARAGFQTVGKEQDSAFLGHKFVVNTETGKSKKVSDGYQLQEKEMFFTMERSNQRDHGHSGKENTKRNGKRYQKNKKHHDREEATFAEFCADAWEARHRHSSKQSSSLSNVEKQKQEMNALKQTLSNLHSANAEATKFLYSYDFPHEELKNLYKMLKRHDAPNFTQGFADDFADQISVIKKAISNTTFAEKPRFTDTIIVEGTNQSHTVNNARLLQKVLLITKHVIEKQDKKGDELTKYAEITKISKKLHRGLTQISKHTNHLKPANKSQRTHVNEEDQFASAASQPGPGTAAADVSDVLRQHTFSMLSPFGKLNI